MKPRFELGASVLQFSKGIRYPVRKPHEKMQVTDRTAGGGLQIEDLGPDIHARPISFKNLPQADWEALCTWFDVVADGAANIFTYYDENGDSMQVRMLTNPFDIPEVSYQRYSGELYLEVVG